MITKADKPIIKGKLSVIVPFVREFPQVAFTLQSLICELRDKGIDFELIFIDNWCQEVADQGLEVDRGTAYMASIQKAHPFLKVIKYDAKLSHWQAKNAGIRESDGEFLFFCDSHCVPSYGSIVRMFRYYRDHYADIGGTLHLPLAYLNERKGGELTYKLVADPEKGVAHYSFTKYRPPSADTHYRVPCMSTCGMMMHRDIYYALGGWPEDLGIYGGGENFINFTLAVLGKTINIMPGDPLYHYADKRGYSWNYDDWVKNRGIAAYVAGDEDFMRRFFANAKGNQKVLDRIAYGVLMGSKEHRKYIESQQVISLDEWLSKQITAST